MLSDKAKAREIAAAVSKLFREWERFQLKPDWMTMRATLEHEVYKAALKALEGSK